MATWTKGFCEPSCACCATLWGCGCIPIYDIVDRLAPFYAGPIPVTRGFAVLWAILFWLGSVYAVGQATLVFWFLLALFAVGAKNKLAVTEDSLYTVVKTLFCAPCMIGQIAEAAKAAYGREPLLVGECSVVVEDC
eukprot:CAMPEP_0171100810 /NCGR_PEP_ID=MMETSP0766_2-20121228/53181_1 /TAXON_ID=439317 /ORGANISM="Gambierdiscus australes, Strain CAWD 149" /LENGTH=135 /DNA_ID=CAMNT_0011560699 /DNA_START=51 /DNA_END=458 /DNA_ORIENTATION=-